MQKSEPSGWLGRIINPEIKTSFIFGITQPERQSYTTITTLHPFNGLYSSTTWTSWYKKGNNQSGLK